jgi:hypothetical protein
MRSRLRRYVRSAMPGAKLKEQMQDRIRRLERLERQIVAPRVPPPCPPGWKIGAPDYVGVGTAKAGTTWWNRAISSHPHVYSRRKEVHFFQHHWNEEFTDVHIAQYHRYFPRPEGKISGEWTPRYMFDPWTPQQLHKSAPDARVLVLLRDPIARLRSGLRYLAFRYSGQMHPRLVDEAIAFGQYGDQLERLTRHFPRTQILVLQLERCIADSEGELARTFDFIGVDPSFVPDDLHDPVNEGQGPPMSISSDLIECARELYVADARSLSDWPEIDLALWPGVTPR